MNKFQRWYIEKWIELLWFTWTVRDKYNAKVLSMKSRIKRKIGK